MIALVLVAVSALLGGVAFGKPSAVLPVVPSTLALGTPITLPAAAISSQYHAQDELGQYNYGYSNGLSSKAEIKSIDGVTRGGYSYIDADGILQSVEYSSDALHGFRVAATNLPVAPIAPVVPALPQPLPVQETPEVAEAKAKHLAALEEAKTRNAEIISASPSVVATKTTTEIKPVIAKTSVVSPLLALPASVKTLPVLAAPTGYSYVINSGLIGQPIISAYSAVPWIAATIPSAVVPEQVAAVQAKSASVAEPEAAKSSAPAAVAETKVAAADETKKE